MRPLTLALLLALATAAGAQNWNGDPLTGTPAPSMPAGAGARGAKEATAAGKLKDQPSFDDYTLSIEWHPEFCAYMASKGRSFGECASGSADSMDGLTLHGLWPDQDGNRDFGFCGVDSQTQSLDQPGQFCNLPDVGLSASDLRQLAAAMPGAGQTGPNGCLERHEWYKHGTCSGLAPAPYFSLEAGLYGQVAGSGLGTFISQNAGSTVSASDLIAAARQDWGDAGAGALTLSCGRLGSSEALSEIRLTLSPSIGPGSDLSGSFLQTGDRGNCPASFLIVAPGQ